MASDVFHIAYCMKALIEKHPAAAVMGESGPINVSVSCPVNGLENFDTHIDTIMQTDDFLLFKTGNGGVIAVRWETVLAISARREAFNGK